MLLKQSNTRTALGSRALGPLKEGESGEFTAKDVMARHMEPFFKHGRIHAPKVDTVDEFAIGEACQARQLSIYTAPHGPSCDQHWPSRAMIGATVMILRKATTEFAENHDQNTPKIAMNLEIADKRFQRVVQVLQDALV